MLWFECPDTAETLRAMSEVNAPTYPVWKTKTPAGRTPHRCPVCGGNGQVPTGFYGTTTGTVITNTTNPEPCRSCEGKGVLWEPQGE